MFDSDSRLKPRVRNFDYFSNFRGKSLFSPGSGSYSRLLEDIVMRQTILKATRVKIISVI